MNDIEQHPETCRQVAVRAAGNTGIQALKIRKFPDRIYINAFESKFQGKGCTPAKSLDMKIWKVVTTTT